MLFAAAAAIAAVVAVPGPAQAVPPQVQPFQQLLPGTDISVPELPAAANPEDGYCRFPVVIDYLSTQAPKGPNNVVAGFASATVTRLDTGKTLTFNASGPGKFTDLGGGAFTLDASGPWLTWTQVKNLYQGVGAPLAYTNGHLQYEVDASGNTTKYELNGKSTNVCDLLDS
jgi:hypothetical protein